jgi:hypothetical protein
MRHAYFIAGCLGLLAIATALATDLISILLAGPGYSPIADSISKLAIGDRAWIQDLGIDALGVGLIVLGVASLLVARGDTGWSGKRGWGWFAGCGMLIVAGADLFVIAEHNEYGGDQSMLYTVHLYATILLYLLFGGLTLCMHRGLATGKGWRGWSLAIGVAWLIVAPWFFVVMYTATGYDGLVERAAALLFLAWVGGVSWRLIAVSRDTPEDRPADA